MKKIIILSLLLFSELAFSTDSSKSTITIKIISSGEKQPYNKSNFVYFPLSVGAGVGAGGFIGTLLAQGFSFEGLTKAMLWGAEGVAVGLIAATGGVLADRVKTLSSNFYYS